VHSAKESLFQVKPEHQLVFGKHQKLSVWKTGASTCRLSQKFLVGRNLYVQLTMNSSKNFLSLFFFIKYVFLSMGKCKILLKI